MKTKKSEMFNDKVEYYNFDAKYNESFNHIERDKEQKWDYDNDTIIKDDKYYYTDDKKLTYRYVCSTILINLTRLEIFKLRHYGSDLNE